MKSRSKLGMVFAIILVLVVSLAAGAIASDLINWRTENGRVVQKNANEFLQVAKDGSKIVKAKDLYKANFLTEDPSDDYLILDVRQPKKGKPANDEYINGHIPGAIFIAPWHDMAKPENLDTLDDYLACHYTRTGNKKIVVYCHTGHTAGFAAAVLASIGYDVSNLRFGYNVGWAASTSSVSSIGINDNDTGAGPTTKTVTSICEE